MVPRLHAVRAFTSRRVDDMRPKETGSGAKLDRAERHKVIGLAQARRIDVVLITELSRWGRSTLDLLHTLKALESKPTRQGG